MTVLSFLQASKYICKFLGYLSNALKICLHGEPSIKKKKKKESKQYDIFKLLNVVLIFFFFKRNSIKDPQVKSLGVHTGT